MTDQTPDEPSPSSFGGTFDPAKHLTRVGGGDYLEVKWRLVWLRDRHPEADVITEMIRYDDNEAVFKATVTIYEPRPELPVGRKEHGRATGYGSETKGDFRDFFEKAETKAIGRALAALGFGTQFCPDHEFGAAQGRVVDSPINRVITQLPSGNSQNANQSPKMISLSQRKMIDGLLIDLGTLPDNSPANVDGMTVAQASEYIKALLAKKAGNDIPLGKFLSARR